VVLAHNESGRNLRAMAKRLKKKGPNPIDTYVGSRIRMQRLLHKMSQKSLGRQTGVTFQQVQKYENGVTRVSASRLQEIASVFDVSPAFFFEGVPTIPGDRRRSAPVASYVSEFLSTVEGLELVKAFMRVKSKDLRWAVVALVDQIAPGKN
jgi:transcriptional regulator with XRE-family HTH domain